MDISSIQNRNGELNMTKIKIYVSHRVDYNASIIDNNIYIPVRCGAVYDHNPSSKMLGDNTGDNISEKRMSFCELTVLYWAWKNQKADYYGLCHYRRYLSFSNNIGTYSNSEHNQGCISIPDLKPETIKKFNLSYSYMQKEIEKYDAIFMEPIDLKALNIKSNYEAMKNSPDYHNIKDVDRMMNIIKDKYPQMYETAYNYMYEDSKSFLYNCFIMKAEIFHNFCFWFFDILFELESQIDKSKYSMQQYRTIGTLGERLLGIYIKWLQKQNKYKLKYTPLLFVEDTTVEDNLKPAFTSNNIPIVSNFNDNYASIFSVFLSSAIAHSSATNNYDFIVLSDDISEQHKRILTNMMKKNMSIRYISPKRYLATTNLTIRHQVYSPDLYYRIIIPQILKEYNKVIVVDADMICQEDIGALYNENINNYLAGGCIDSVLQGYLNGADPSFMSYALNYMKMIDPYKYINTGLLIFNAEKYRQIYSLEFLNSFITEHAQYVKIYEQDMLNMLLDGKIKFLDPKWNCYTKSNEFINKCFSLSPLETYKKYEIARSSNQGIIHYAAHPKPWWNATVDLADIWWKYAKISPCYEEILQILIAKQANISQLRKEFIDIHFPNINKHFNKIETTITRHIVSSNLKKLKLKKLEYLLKSIIFFWNAKKYKIKRKKIKDIINKI